MLVLTRKISLSKLAVSKDCDFEGNICQIISPVYNRVILHLKTKDFNLIRKADTHVGTSEPTFRKFARQLSKSLKVNTNVSFDIKINLPERPH